LNSRWARDTDDETAYYLRVAGDPSLADYIQQGDHHYRPAPDSLLIKAVFSDIRGIVRKPATIQSAKGLLSAGLGSSMRYTAGKVGKWWQGSRSSS
jgi:translocator assembly and maintenance protein 41